MLLTMSQYHWRSRDASIKDNTIIPTKSPKRAVNVVAYDALNIGMKMYAKPRTQSAYPADERAVTKESENPSLMGFKFSCANKSTT